MCGKSYRLLPDDQIPNKHYSAEVIEKVVDEDYEFSEDEQREMEDYPCEATKERWKAWADRKHSIMSTTYKETAVLPAISIHCTFTFEL